MILFGASTDIVGLYAQSAQYPVQSKLVFNQVSRANKSRLWFRIRAKLISALRYRDSHGGELSPAWLADNRKNTSLSSCGLVNAGGARVWGRDRQPPPHHHPRCRARQTGVHPGWQGEGLWMRRLHTALCTCPRPCTWQVNNCISVESGR